MQHSSITVMEAVQNDVNVQVRKVITIYRRDQSILFAHLSA